MDMVILGRIYINVIAISLGKHKFEIIFFLIGKLPLWPRYGITYTCVKVGNFL